MVSVKYLNKHAIFPTTIEVFLNGNRYSEPEFLHARLDWDRLKNLVGCFCREDAVKTIKDSIENWNKIIESQFNIGRKL